MGRFRDYFWVFALGLIVGVVLASMWLADLSPTTVDQLLITVTGLNVVVLGTLTYISVEQSRKMAQAATAQVAALKEDRTPKLVATLSRNPESKIGGPKSETFVLMNLSSHSVWIDKIEKHGGGTPTVFRREGSLEGGLPWLYGGVFLPSGEKLEINFQDLGQTPPFLYFEFFFAPTGNKLHSRLWAIETIDGVHRVYEAPHA